MPRAREHESEEGVWGGQPAGVEARVSAVGRWRGRPRRGRRCYAFLSEEASKKFFCAQPGRNPQARKLLEGSDSAILACAGQAGVGRLFASSKGTCQRCKQYKNLLY